MRKGHQILIYFTQNGTHIIPYIIPRHSSDGISISVTDPAANSPGLIPLNIHSFEEQNRIHAKRISSLYMHRLGSAKPYVGLFMGDVSKTKISELVIFFYF